MGEWETGRIKSGLIRVPHALFLVPHTSFIRIESTALSDPRYAESYKSNRLGPEDKTGIGMGGKKEIEKEYNCCQTDNHYHTTGYVDYISFQFSFSRMIFPPGKEENGK